MDTSSKILMLYNLWYSKNLVKTYQNEIPSKILMLYELLNHLPEKPETATAKSDSMMTKIRSARKRAMVHLIFEKINLLSRKLHAFFTHTIEEKNTLLQVSIIMDKLLVSFLENNVSVLTDNDEAKCIHNHIEEVIIHCEDLLFLNCALRRNIIGGIMRNDLTWWRFIFLLALFLRQIESDSCGSDSTEQYAKKVVSYLDTQNGWKHLHEYLGIHKTLQENFGNNTKGVLQSIIVLTIFLLVKL